MTEQELCGDTCSYGCSLKLLEFIELEITEWEQRLDNGDIPDFRDIRKLSKSSTQVYKALIKNNLVDETKLMYIWDQNK